MALRLRLPMRPPPSPMPKSRKEREDCSTACWVCLNKFQEARHGYPACRNTAFGRSRVRIRFGDIFMVRKEYREAIETYAQGASKNAVLDNKMGIAYHQLMDLDRARKCYEQALKLKPDYFEAINNLGTVYYAKKNYRRAIVWYNRALKVDPDSPRAASTYMNRGTAWFARKQYDKALEDYQTAVHIEPDIFEHHGTFGQILEERNVEERAKYHFFLAKLYARQGRNELALQNLRKALEEGFKGKKKLEEEPDFATLKDLPDFKTLLASEPRAL
jgi:tetratricopeptide (TPR) repeat protein